MATVLEIFARSDVGTGSPTNTEVLGGPEFLYKLKVIANNPPGACDDNDGDLEVGETWSFTAQHTVTQAEIDAGGNFDGPDEGTAASVRVMVESRAGAKTWTTVGVHTNIIEASWRALADSVEYGLMVAH